MVDSLAWRMEAFLVAFLAVALATPVLAEVDEVWEPEPGDHYLTCPGAIGSIGSASMSPFRATLPVTCYVGTHTDPGEDGGVTQTLRTSTYVGEFRIKKLAQPYRGNYHESLHLNGQRVIWSGFNCSENPWAADNPAAVCSWGGTIRTDLQYIGITTEDWDILQQQIVGRPSSSAPWSAVLATPSVRTLLANMQEESEFQAAHSDMDLSMPSNPAELTINEPRGVVPGDKVMFQLDVTAAGLVPVGAVAEIEWARIVASKDTSLDPTGNWRHDEPEGAPASAPFDQFPRSIPIKGLFAPGKYAVRVTLRDSNFNSDWVRFEVKAPPATAGRAQEGRGLSKTDGFSKSNQGMSSGSRAPARARSAIAPQRGSAGPATRAPTAISASPQASGDPAAAAAPAAEDDNAAVGAKPVRSIQAR